MEANKLRIGNLIQGKKYKTALTVRVIDANFLCVEPVPNYENDVLQIDNLDEVEGIPLTEDWLLKMGVNTKWTEKEWFYLTKYQDGYFYYDHECYQLDIPSIKLEYVHSLQNLYFALTNTELTINL